MNLSNSGKKDKELHNLFVAHGCFIIAILLLQILLSLKGFSTISFLLSIFLQLVVFAIIMVFKVRIYERYDYP